MKHADKIKWMHDYATKHNVQLQLEGEVGFGRDCVGIVSDNKYPDYEWYDNDFNQIDSNGEVWVPENAYHKHPCVAVLGSGKKAEEQLYNWLKWFEDNNFVIEITDRDDLRRLSFPEILIKGTKFVRMVRKTQEPQNDNA